MKPKFIPVNEEFKRTLDWREISEECDDLLFLEENLKNLVPECLSENYHAVPLLMKHKELIDLIHLGANTNPIAIDYFETKLHELEDSKNRFGIIVYKLEFLFQNTSKKAIKLIEKILLDDDYDEKYNSPFLRNIASNESAIHILEAYFKDEELNGEELNEDEYLHRCFRDPFENGLWGGECAFDPNGRARASVFRNLATNKNASPYLINEINTFIAQCEEYNKTDYMGDPLCNDIIKEMVRNTENKNMVEAGKKWLRVYRRNLCVISNCIYEIALDKHIDIIEEFMPVLLDIKRWYQSGGIHTSLGCYDIKEYDSIEHYSSQAWIGICSMEHPRAMEIAQENLDFLIYLNDWKDANLPYVLSKNPLAMPILEIYDNKFFNVDYALENPNEDIYPLIKKHFKDITWYLFQADNKENLADGEDIFNNVRPEIFPEDLYLECGVRRADATLDAGNRNSNIIRRGEVNMRKYFTKLYEDGFRDPTLEEHIKANSFEFCRKNIVCVNTTLLQSYPSCYFRGLFSEIDYEGMKKENIEFSSELASYVFNPARVERMADSFGIEFSDYLESLE